MEDDSRPEQRSIQSIDVGFRLIRVLEEAGGKLALKTLSARADMPPGKAHLYLVSFARLGLVVQDEASGHYGLGPYAVQLGLSALRQLNIADVARGPLESLHARFELPTYLSIWGRMGPFILLKHEIELPTPFSIRVGFVFPLLSTATGNIFLAHMPNRETSGLLEAEGRVNPDLLATADDIRSEIRARGYAASRGHLFRGFSGLSAPVFDHEGALAGAITMLGVATLMDAKPSSSMVAALRDAAAEISRGLGYDLDHPKLFSERGVRHARGGK